MLFSSALPGGFFYRRLFHVRTLLIEISSNQTRYYLISTAFVKASPDLCKIRCTLRHNTVTSVIPSIIYHLKLLSHICGVKNGENALVSGIVRNLKFQLLTFYACRLSYFFSALSYHYFIFCVFFKFPIIEESDDFWVFFELPIINESHALYKDEVPW